MFSSELMCEGGKRERRAYNEVRIYPLELQKRGSERQPEIPEQVTSGEYRLHQCEECM